VRLRSPLSTLPAGILSRRFRNASSFGSPAAAPVVEIWRDEHRHLRAAPWRSGRVPEDLEQIVDRRQISILRSGRREGLALPRLASNRCSVSRAFRATGALSETPVLSGHLDTRLPVWGCRTALPHPRALPV